LGPNTVSAPAAGGRPAILSLAIKEKAALYAAYMPYLKNGGVFVPTNRPYKLGDEVYLILTLMNDPAKYPIAGAWSGSAPPAAPRARRASACIFPVTRPAWRRRRAIEDLLGSALKSGRPTHTI
jgi:type IV pilus assembly protein PilZ